MAGRLRERTLAPPRPAPAAEVFSREVPAAEDAHDGTRGRGAVGLSAFHRVPDGLPPGCHAHVARFRRKSLSWRIAESVSEYARLFLVPRERRPEALPAPLSGVIG